MSDSNTYPRNAERVAVITPEQAHKLFAYGNDALLKLVIPGYDSCSEEGPVSRVIIGQSDKTDVWHDGPGLTERLRMAQSVTNILHELDTLDAIYHSINDVDCPAQGS